MMVMCIVQTKTTTKTLAKLNRSAKPTKKKANKKLNAVGKMRGKSTPKNCVSANGNDTCIFAQNVPYIQQLTFIVLDIFLRQIAIMPVFNVNNNTLVFT